MEAHHEISVPIPTGDPKCYRHELEATPVVD